MPRRSFGGFLILAAALPLAAQTVPVISAQAGGSVVRGGVRAGINAAAKNAKPATTTRTADGHPDLSGYWTNATLIPLERPAGLGMKEFYTEAEALAMDKERVRKENSQAKDDIHYDNVIWQQETFSKVTSRRTSIVFDPPDGHLPPLTEAGKKHELLEKEAARRRDLAERAEDRNLGERCIAWGNEGPPMLGSTYNANLEVIQTPSALAIHHEIGHSVRIIPTDGRPHP